MDNSVIQLCQFRAVPTLGCTYEVTSDTLQAVNLCRLASWTLLQLLLGILIAAIHTAVAVVVHRAVADVVLVEKVYDIHNRLWVVSCVTVNLHIEDVTTTSQCVVWCLNLSLVLWRAAVIYWDMV